MFYEEVSKKSKASKKTNTLKAICIAIIIIITIGIAYASVTIYKINKKQADIEAKKQSIRESILSTINTDEAREKIRIILEKLEITDYDVSKLEFTKNAKASNIYWKAEIENFSVEIDATTGELIYYSDYSFDFNKIKSKSTKQKAEQIVCNMYEKLGFSDEYKLAYLEKHTISDDTCLWQAEFRKEYDGVYNWHEGIRITFVPEIERISVIKNFDNSTFDDNEIKLSKEDALNIIKEKNNYKDISDLEAELFIESEGNVVIDKEYPLNTDEDIESYLNDYENMTAKKNTRRAWKVTDYTEGMTEYSVDATTGEIIKVGSYGVMLPDIEVNGAWYYQVSSKNIESIYDKEIKQEDLGKVLGTVKPGTVNYNKNYDNAKIYEFLSSKSKTLVVVDLNGKYKLFSFVRFTNQKDNTVSKLLSIYGIKDENNITKIEIKRDDQIVSQVNGETGETTNENHSDSKIDKTITDKETIKEILGIYKSAKEVSQNSFIKDIQQYYPKDGYGMGPYKNSVDIKIYTENNTYLYITYLPVCKYLESYSKNYKLNDAQITFMNNICN